MNFIIVYLVVFLGGILNPSFHPVHVSICTIELSDNENIVAIKLFKDDLSLVLKNNYQMDVPMEKADEKLNREVISKYINTSLQIIVNNSEKLELHYQKSEINEDAIWIYFQVEKIKNGTQLSIKNTLLLNLWEDQTNLLIINWKGQENGYRFNRSESEIDIDLTK